MKAYSYIRWSTPGQIAGDSLRRQMTAATEYAAKHNLQLDTSTYIDAGVSAFRGKNLIEGKLGAFIKAVDDGKIKTPCYLLVEELDRISRDDILEAQHLFTSIIQRNITLVVLKTNQVFSKSALKGMEGLALMLGALISLTTANEESAKKSKRLKAVFEQKTEGIRKGIIASRYCPSWLTVNEDKTKFIVDQKKAKTLRRIFDLALAGNGVQKIAQILNDDDVELVGSKKSKKSGWLPGNVAGFLRQPALTGSFIKTATGEEINPHYYPQIISKKDWNAVQSSVQGRRNKGGYGQGTANLFSCLTYCAYCGATFKFITNGTKRTYLYCRNSQAHNNCDVQMFPYDTFESDLVMYLAQHIYDDLSANEMKSTNASRRKELQQAITVKQHDVEKWVKAIERSKTKPDVLVDRLDEAQRELDDLQAELATLNQNPLTKASVDELQAQLEMVWPILGRHNPEPDDPDFTPEAQQAARLKIQVALRRLIKRIDVAAFLDEHKKFWKEFKVTPYKGSFNIKDGQRRVIGGMGQLNMIRITYVDGTMVLTDWITSDTRLRNKKNAEIALQLEQR